MLELIELIYYSNIVSEKHCYINYTNVSIREHPNTEAF